MPRAKDAKDAKKRNESYFPTNLGGLRVLGAGPMQVTLLPTPQLGSDATSLPPLWGNFRVLDSAKCQQAVPNIATGLNVKERQEYDPSIAETWLPG